MPRNAPTAVTRRRLSIHGVLALIGRSEGSFFLSREAAWERGGKRSSTNLVSTMSGRWRGPPTPRRESKS